MDGRRAGETERLERRTEVVEVSMSHCGTKEGEETDSVIDNMVGGLALGRRLRMRLGNTTGSKSQD